MDFDKIKSQALLKALDISVQEILDNPDSDNVLKIEDEELRDEVGLINLLQKFGAQVSLETIKIYHEELSKKLEKQGIKI